MNNQPKKAGVLKKEIEVNSQEFENKTGYAPERDDLERVNCKDAGAVGHSQCGWCTSHDLPRFQCGCRMKAQKELELSLKGE